MAKSKRQLADEAYERSERDRATLLGLSVGLPVGGDTLPGQIDLNGATAGEVGDDEPVVIANIPEHCPECHKVMTLAHGWTPLDRSVRAPAIQSVRAPAIQCGNCGVILQTTDDAWAILKSQIKAHFARMSAPPPPKKSKRGRNRGAR